MNGYKTIGFAFLLFLLALARLGGLEEFTLPAEWQPYFDLAVPVVFALLRAVTKTAIFKQE